MYLDFGQVLTRGFQITRKHKALWLFGALPSLVALVLLPLFLVIFSFVFQPDASRQFARLQPIYFVFFSILIVVWSLLNFIVYGISSAAITAGTLRAEAGDESFSVRDVFNESKKYWLRTLGVYFLLSVLIGVVFSVFFGCLILFGMVTLGLGFICIQPLSLLSYPLMAVINGGIEEALAAVIADDLDLFAAIQRGWEVFKANFWQIAILSVLLYLILMIVGMLFAIPFIALSFFFPFLGMQDNFLLNLRAIMLIFAALSLLLAPVMALIQGVLTTFLKAVFAIAYLRLTRPAGGVSPLSETNA